MAGDDLMELLEYADRHSLQRANESDIFARAIARLTALERENKQLREALESALRNNMLNKGIDFSVAEAAAREEVAALTHEDKP